MILSRQMIGDAPAKKRQRATAVQKLAHIPPARKREASWTAAVPCRFRFARMR